MVGSLMKVIPIMNFEIWLSEISKSLKKKRQVADIMVAIFDIIPYSKWMKLSNW